MRPPSEITTAECYRPHENITWGDFWMVMYSFAKAQAQFANPEFNIFVEMRVQNIFRELTNIPYTGKFWEEEHHIDFIQMINSLKPEHLAQITA
jgi:hypothetical protein